eukprot:scaffold174150_cov58-Attheya_sp.AAC.2
MGTARILLESKSYMTKTYTWLRADVIGNPPGRSVEMIPFRSANFTAFTPTKCLWSMLPRGGSRADGRMPLRMRCMWPITVIGDVGRCFLIAAVVRPGQLLNQSFAIALIQVAGGREPTQACR